MCLHNPYPIPSKKIPIVTRLPKRREGDIMSNNPTPQFTLDRFPEAIQFLVDKVNNLEHRLEQKEIIVPTKRLASRKELMEFLGVCELTVIRMEKKNIISSIPVGSSRKYDLQKVVKDLEKHEARKKDI
jgi:hypothetical protein